MQRGPKPKSPEQKLAEGDLAKVGRNKLKAEARTTRAHGGFELGIPRTPPAHLSPRAKQKWRQYVPMIEGMKISSRPDGCMLEGFCVAFDMAVQAEQSIQEHGVMLEEPIIVDGDEGPEVVGFRRKANPACNIALRARSEMKKFAEQFGFSPTAVQRLATVDKKNKTAGESLMDKLSKAPPPRPQAQAQQPQAQPQAPLSKPVVQ